MAERDYKAFIVEGRVREPQIIDNISKVFFPHSNCEIIKLPVEENIYMLWKSLKKDDFDTDIIEVLRESNDDIRNQLNGLSRDDFSEVYLFFDYDLHQTNIAKEEGPDAIMQMLNSFNNETENGKLYISYPMAEALRDYIPDVCGDNATCYVSVGEMKKYKNVSSDRSTTPQFKEYDYEVWKGIIDVFAMKVSCLFGLTETMKYEQYMEAAEPSNVYIQEKKETKKGRVFVLSAFPEFLVDYFGAKLWKNSVKHRRTRRDN